MDFVVCEQNIDELRNDDIKVLFKLCFRGVSMLREELQAKIFNYREYKAKNDSKYFIGKLDDKIVSWCMVNTYKRRKELYGIVMLYVRKKYRRKGYGSQLIQSAIDYCKANDLNIEVYPHDNESRQFYIKFGLSDVIA